MLWGVASPMQTARRSHSCIIHPNNDALYAIGGSSTDTFTATIEKVFIDNVDDKQWIYLNGSLMTAMKGLRSFIYDNHIIIIGGVDKSRRMHDTIHIVDIYTDLVRVSNMTLAFATVYSAVIMVNNIMYSFAGRFGVDSWQSNTISTMTIAPTITNTTIPQLPSDTNVTTAEAKKEEETDESGLDTGNIIGIAFAVALLICLLIIVAFCGIRGTFGGSNVNKV
eukprot:228925_1